MKKDVVALLGALTAGFSFAAAPIRIPVADPSAELGTVPDKAYVIDYWTPPTDMVPASPIANYTPNVRVPCYRWVKYDGAYALALDIRPIDVKKIEQEIAVGLIDTNKNRKALSFDLAAEKNAGFRKVGIYRLGLDAAEFCGVSFKVRAKAKNAGASLSFALAGRGISLGFDTEKTVKGLVVEPAKDGFTGYTFTFSARKDAVIDSLVFEAAAATAADFEQQYEIIDFHLKRPAPKARFTDLPARRWTKKANIFGTDEPLKTSACIADIFAYARGEGAADTIAALPKSYELRPQLEKEKDGGFTVEYVTAKVGEKDLPAVKITLEKGPRCLLRFPLAFDGLDYNTMTFVGKVEVFDGAKPVLGDVKPMLWGANQHSLNEPFDTFQIAFFSKTDDFCDWTRWGLAQADWCQNKDLSCAVSHGKDGWRAFAYDIANSDPSNNKSSYYSKLTHWLFYYDNKKIPAGKKVVVTIADPRFTKGLMLAGGDLAKYKEFLKTHDVKRMVDAEALKSALEPPKAGRLAQPIRFIENRIPVGAIYQLPPTYPRDTTTEARAAYTTILADAVQEFCTVLERKYGLATDIPVETRIQGAVRNSIIVGGDAYAKVNRKQYEEDLKTLAQKPGCVIRSDGTNIYIYAPADYNYAGNVRGLAFGLYELLENNTDLIYSRKVQARRWGPAWPNRIFTQDVKGNFDFVWGDGFVHAPTFPEGNMDGVGGVNRIPGYSWEGNWAFGRHRTRSINHWFGYGTEPIGNEERGKPNDTWGRKADGTLMQPGCYTGHPCLIRVLDRARESYVQASGWSPRNSAPFNGTQAPGRAFAWNCYDVHGLWVEDSISMCQCKECLTPIRLADGSTVGPDSPYFRSTQFYSNGSAMINALNVYAKRDVRIESIGYFWMAPVPLMTPSRNYDIRFCPYIRKNYFVPIFAPMNDMHWRAINAWAQQDVRLAFYEYFLYVGLRPWADVAAYDLRAESALGKLYDWHAESQNAAFSRMDQWVMERLIWGSMGDDVPALRAYYLKRTYREAADAMAKFYSLVMSTAAEKLAFASPIEFEDDQIIYRTALRTKGNGLFAGTVADRLEKYVVEAEKAVKDPLAAIEVKNFRQAWDEYRTKAATSEKNWKDDCAGGAASKLMKIVGAPE